MAPVTPLAAVSQLPWCRAVCLSQNFTRSAGRCAQPFRPKKEMPRRFWAIPISFRSKNRASTPRSKRPSAGPRSAAATKELSIVTRRGHRIALPTLLASVTTAVAYCSPTAACDYNRPRQMTPIGGSGSAVVSRQFQATEAAHRDIADLPARKVA